MRPSIWIGSAALLFPMLAAAAPVPHPEPAMSFTISSPNFTADRAIPRRHTCDGEDASPALTWRGAPAGTKSFALIVDDPDAPDPKAPKMVWVHWVLFGIPADATGLPEAVKPADLPKGTKAGLNDWKATGWRGPCPPIGRHRYYFRLLALDFVPEGLGTPTRAELERAIEGHVLGRATLMGTYQRAGR
jgi:hypothetical protein